VFEYLLPSASKQTRGFASLAELKVLPNLVA